MMFDSPHQHVFGRRFVDDDGTGKNGLNSCNVTGIANEVDAGSKKSCGYGLGSPGGVDDHRIEL